MNQQSTLQPGPADVRSEHFSDLLRLLSATLLVTTYQAGRLIVVRAADENVSLLLRRFDRAMGVAAREHQLALGTRNQVWFFERLAQSPYRPTDEHVRDVCYAPRRSHVTGDIRIHELAWAGEELWLVNTRFSCLCTLGERHSFVPRWQPPFISELRAEDRCHLNGLAVTAGSVRYVTAFGVSDKPAGWRPQRLDGGIVLDVASGEVITHGLCMPHSPRIDDGKLYLLNSGHGQLEAIDVASGRRDVICQVPGYARGLAIAGGYAFIGLSQMRRSRMFADLPINTAPNECGVYAIDLARGTVVARLTLPARVREIFDVHLLIPAAFASIVGCEQSTVNRCLVWPGGAASS